MSSECSCGFDVKHTVIHRQQHMCHLPKRNRASSLGPHTLLLFWFLSIEACAVQTALAISFWPLFDHDACRTKQPSVEVYRYMNTGICVQAFFLSSFELLPAGGWRAGDPAERRVQQGSCDGSWCACRGLDPLGPGSTSDAPLLGRHMAPQECNTAS